MIDVTTQFEHELLWSEPIVYKGITFHPIKVEDSMSFKLGVTSLLYDQLEYPDQNVAFKPRLNFLLEMRSITEGIEDSIRDKLWDTIFEDDYSDSEISNLIEKEREVSLFSRIEYQLWIAFVILLKQIFGDQEIEFVDPSNPSRKVIVINHKVFGSKDFDDFRQIILHSNGVEFNDEFIHSDIKERIKRDSAVLNKHKTKPPSFEDLIDSVFMYTGKDYDFIKNMTLRKFNRLMKRMNMYEEYKICKTASLSGFVSFKGEIEHWISPIEKTDPMKALFKSREDVVDKYKKI